MTVPGPVVAAACSVAASQVNFDLVAGTVGAAVDSGSPTLPGERGEREGERMRERGKRKGGERGGERREEKEREGRERGGEKERGREEGRERGKKRGGEEGRERERGGEKLNRLSQVFSSEKIGLKELQSQPLNPTLHDSPHLLHGLLKLGSHYLQLGLQLLKRGGEVSHTHWNTRRSSNKYERS